LDQTLKRRIGTAIYLFVVGVAGTWWNWHLVHKDGSFYPKLAMICPACFVFTGYFLVVPVDPFEKPEWSAKAIIAIVVSVLLGLLNWYAFANGYFY
jgi:hypothetical protein